MINTKSKASGIRIKVKMEYPTNEKREPHYLKILKLDDMKRFKYKITRELLIKNGFDTFEINWLIDNNKI